MVSGMHARLNPSYLQAHITRMLSVRLQAVHLRACRAPVCPFLDSPGRSRHGLARTSSQLTSANGASVRTAEVLVQQVLDLVQGSDGGANLSDAQKNQVDDILEQLEVIGSTRIPRPLNDPHLWGNYEVAYTSINRTARQDGEPAGGRFRGGIGRALFRTTGLYQSVLQPDLVTNKVAFKLFGLIGGDVGLRGKIVPVDNGNEDTVRVLFEPSIIHLGPLTFSLGEPSQVQLTTTYLDQRVRLGKGSRGSLFIFTRSAKADGAGMDQVGLQPAPTHAGPLVVAGYVAFMLGALAALTAAPHPAMRTAAVGVLVLGLLLGRVFRLGGLVRNRPVETQAAPQQPAAAST